MADLYDRIYLLVEQIPRGRVTTYGHLAAMCGISDPREVGAAMNASQGIPWQRVINSRGEISIKGATGARQRSLLQDEGIVFKSDGRVDLGEYGWVPDPGWLESNHFNPPPPYPLSKKHKSGESAPEEGDQPTLF